jgi:hypothetical protein
MFAKMYVFQLKKGRFKLNDFKFTLETIATILLVHAVVHELIFMWKKYFTHLDGVLPVRLACFLQMPMSYFWV